MFVLWAVSLNYKVVYDRGAASVCVSKLRGQRCETTASACEVWHTLIKTASSACKKRTENEGQ